MNPPNEPPKTPRTSPLCADPPLSAELEQEVHFRAVRIAAQYIYDYGTAQKERQKGDQVVFSPQALPEADGAGGCPADFTGVLATNARALNAAFTYYLENAHKSPAADQKMVLAMRLQGQLIRTIDTWRRLEESQNGETK